MAAVRWMVIMAALYHSAVLAAMCRPTEFLQLVPHLTPQVQSVLQDRGISSPTPIQRAALPRVLNGESVVLHAETGSGKSLAFLLPAILRLGEGEKMLVVAPTRELAVQLANEAAGLVTDPSEVQIIAIGATPLPQALLDARVICCTAPEMVALIDLSAETEGVLTEVLSRLRVVVLDELDSLLPIETVYGPRAAERKRSANKQRPEPPAQQLLRAVFESNMEPQLQLVAASATVSRPSRLKLERVLRRDPLGRWFTSSLPIVRPAEIANLDLSTISRAVVIPSGVRHYYVRMPARVPSAGGGNAASRLAASGKGRVTLKQKRLLRAMKAKAASADAIAKAAHPLLLSLQHALNELQPSSALVFLCRSSGLTVRRAAKQLQRMGVSALPLHEAIGLEHAAAFPSNEGEERQTASLRKKRVRVDAGTGGQAGDADADTDESEDDDDDDDNGDEWFAGTYDDANGYGSADLSVLLQQRHTALSAAFRKAGLNRKQEATDDGDVDSAKTDSTESDAGASGYAGSSTESPLLITFEDMARGLHFDGVEVVFILGLPDSPSTYLHLAGRTGRQPVLNGTVVTICPGKSHTQLCGWSERLGKLAFTELNIAGLRESIEASRRART
uniref:ATP-dependent RNA helicase n=1 Tax=Chrysotila carterae TaxID=13221 RepID=A0A7S4BGH9_CHRCT